MGTLNLQGTFNSQSIFVIVQVMKMQKFISKELNLFYQSSVR